MVRKKTDPFWKYVEVCQNKDRWKCKFCDKEYPGHASRIKAHLGQVKNRGIEICDKVDARVKEEALAALHKEAPDKQQGMAEETTQWDDPGIGSENNPDVDLSLDYSLLQDFLHVYNEAFLQEQSQQVDPLPNLYFQQQHEVDTMTGTSQDLQGHNTNGHGVNEHSVSLCKEFDQSLLTLKRKLEYLSNQKEEKEEELYQWSKKLRNQKQEKEEELHQLSKKLRTIKRGYKRMNAAQSKGNRPTLEKLNEVKELINHAEELGNFHVSEKEASRSAPTPQATPFLTSKLIGRGLESSKIRDSLASDDILRICVYGMGGVGKTEIMMNIYNELLNSKAFDSVFWVTMPKIFCVYELQSAIGTAVHLEELSNEKDEKIRAAMLYAFFTSGKKYVIILDGLWRHFNYDKIGIPWKYDGLKLAITCQSLRLSRSMSCQKEIRIEPIDYKDGWDLFRHELGVEMELPKEVEKIAKVIVESCNGLPLYINAAATRLRRVAAVQEWSDMMEKMNDPKQRFHTLKGQVFDQLKLSYELLNDHELQQCLIFCAFYCGLKAYPTLEAMEKFLVDVGVIDQRNSRGKLLHRARYNLKELEKACLLSIENEDEDGEEIIEYDGEEVIGYDGEEVIKMHVSIIDMALHVAADTNLFMVDCGIGSLLEGFQIEVSDELWLMRDARDEISRLSSNEIRLPILLSKRDCRLRMIPDSLFIVFSEIKFLDLSDSMIEELPNFVVDLLKLTALVLQDCSKLRHIPNIGKLISLRHLDVFKCTQLKELPDGLEDLVNLEYLNLRRTGIVKIPEGVLRNLGKLQYLYSNFVEAEGIKGLVMLKKLGCMFSTLKDLAKFDDSFHEKGHANTEYAIVVTSEKQRLEKLYALTEHHFKVDKRIVVLFNCEDEEREVIVPPKNVQELHIDANGSQRIRWPDCVGHENLEKLYVYHCPNLRYVMEPEASTRYSFSKLEEICIVGCDGLEEIIAASCLLHPNHFSCLKSLYVNSCNKMKRLLNHDMLRHLSKLESIAVLNCKNMDELIALARPIETIKVFNCPKLKKIPLQMDQLDNGDLVPPSSLREIKIREHDLEWWNSLEWESPEAKQAVQPYLRPVSL